MTRKNKYKSFKKNVRVIKNDKRFYILLKTSVRLLWCLLKFADKD